MCFLEHIGVIMRYHLPLCFPLPFWSMQRSRKNSQPFVFRLDRIGGFLSKELAMYSGLFWNRGAFFFRSRWPKLVSILLPRISFDFMCYASNVQLNKQPTFQVLRMTIEEILCAFSYAKTRMESFELFFTLINISFGAIWGHSTVLNNSKTRQNRAKGRQGTSPWYQ